MKSHGRHSCGMHVPIVPAAQCVRVVRRLFDNTNFVVVKTTKQVDVLIAAMANRLDDNGKSIHPIAYADDYAENYHTLGMQAEQFEIQIKQEADDITLTGKTYNLALFLDEIGFEMTNGAYHPKDLLADFDKLIADVKELATMYGWRVVHERI